MKYKKRPLVVDAIRFNGANHAEIEKFCAPHKIGMSLSTLSIPSNHGSVIAEAGDWIIKGLGGEVYPCKADIFQQTYEPDA